MTLTVVAAFIAGIGTGAVGMFFLMLWSAVDDVPRVTGQRQETEAQWADRQWERW